MELKDTYNKIARDWFNDHNSDDWWMSGVDSLVRLLPPGASVLDVGCGAGHKSAYLLAQGLHVTGADFSEEMIKIAREQVPSVEFAVLDLYTIDSLKQTFDCIFAQAVFLHIPKKDVVEILEKSKKILKKGGLFYIAVKEARAGAPDEKMVTENDYGYEYERFFSFFSVPEFEGYFAEAGFTLVHKEVTAVGNTRWIQMIAKY